MTLLWHQLQEYGSDMIPVSDWWHCSDASCKYISDMVPVSEWWRCSDTMWKNKEVTWFLFLSQDIALTPCERTKKWHDSCLSVKTLLWRRVKEQRSDMIPASRSRHCSDVVWKNKEVTWFLLLSQDVALTSCEKTKKWHDSCFSVKTLLWHHVKKKISDMIPVSQSRHCSDIVWKNKEVTCFLFLRDDIALTSCEKTKKWHDSCFSVKTLLWHRVKEQRSDMIPASRSRHGSDIVWKNKEVTWFLLLSQDIALTSCERTKKWHDSCFDTAPMPWRRSRISYSNRPAFLSFYEPRLKLSQWSFLIPRSQIWMQVYNIEHEMIWRMWFLDNLMNGS